MDSERAFNTHMALFKTRSAGHVHGYWREKAVAAYSRRVADFIYCTVFSYSEESVAAREIH